MTTDLRLTPLLRLCGVSAPLAYVTSKIKQGKFDIQNNITVTCTLHKMSRDRIYTVQITIIHTVEIMCEINIWKCS